MHSIALAMAWEHCKRNAWLMLVATLGPWVFLALPLGGLMFNPDVIGNREFALVIFVFALVGFVPVALRQYNSRQDRLGFPLALYTRPISTAYMVALRMILDVATSIGIYLGLSLLVWATSGVTLPLVIPILFLVVIAAWMEAIFWSMGGSALLLAVIGLGIEYTLFFWLYIGPLVADPGTPIDLTWRVLSTIPLTALAYAVAVVGVRFDRRGDRISLARLAEWIGDRIYTMRRTDQGFRSAQAAQFWLEWHRKGQLLPILNLLAVAVYAGVALLSKQVTLVDGLTFLWGLGFVNLIFYPVLVAILINTKEPGASQDLFWATRPLSDNTLLLVRLRVANASLLASWGVWLAGAIVVSGLLWATGQSQGLIDEVKTPIATDRSGAGLLLVPVYIAWVALYTWTTSGIVGSLHMTGRKTMAALWIAPLLVPTVWAIVVRQGLISPDTAGLIKAVMPWAVGILCLAGTLLAYRAALLNGRITRRVAWIALGAYSTLSLLVLLLPTGPAIVSTEQELGRVVYALGLFAALPLVPLALGPLAIAWNRHR